MDFWDLTKLLFRRWYVAAPLLLLTIGAVFWTSKTVKPDYLATSYVQLIPPTVATETDEGEQKKAPAGPRNPWLELGLGSLSRAATLTVQDQTVLEQLKAAGYSENVVITVDNQQPIVTIEAVGHTEKQATDTLEQVVVRLSDSVKALQADYGAKEESFITTRRLDRGDNLTEVNAKVKRALVAVLGVGMLLSIAATIAFDAVLKRTRRRRSGPDSAAQMLHGTGHPADDTIALPRVSLGKNGTAYVGTNGNTNGGSGHRIRFMTGGRASVHSGKEAEQRQPGAGTRGEDGRPEGVEYISANADADADASATAPTEPEQTDTPGQPVEPTSANGDTAVIRREDDATIVLPLSGGSLKGAWDKRDSGS